MTTETLKERLGVDLAVINSPPFNKWEDHLGYRAKWWGKIPESVVDVWGELSDETKAVAYLIAEEARQRSQP